MKLIHSWEELQQARQSSLLLLYIGSEDCGICNVILPRVEKLTEQYSHLNAVRIDADELPAVTGELGVFTIPCLLVFAEGKEIARQARYINLQELEQQLDRYHQILNT